MTRTISHGVGIIIDGDRPIAVVSFGYHRFFESVMWGPRFRGVQGPIARSRCLAKPSVIEGESPEGSAGCKALLSVGAGLPSAAFLRPRRDFFAIISRQKRKTVSL